MNVLAALVLGLLIGWLIEWIIDWFYWRARMQSALEKSPEQKNPDSEKLEKENTRLDEEHTSLMRAHKHLDEENTDLKERLAKLEAEINQIKTFALIGHLLNQDGTHNLQTIKGIGPTFEKRLHEGGIKTFEQLAQLTPQDMERILGTLYKRFFSKNNKILTQAKEFSKQIAASQGKQKA